MNSVRHFLFLLPFHVSCFKIAQIVNGTPSLEPLYSFLIFKEMNNPQRIEKTFSSRANKTILGKIILKEQKMIFD